MYSESEVCFMCTNNNCDVPVNNRISTEIEYVLPEITITKLDIHLFICFTCLEKLLSFSKFKQVCVENSQHMEASIKFRSRQKIGNKVYSRQSQATSNIVVGRLTQASTSIAGENRDTARDGRNIISSSLNEERTHISFGQNSKENRLNLTRNKLKLPPKSCIQNVTPFLIEYRLLKTLKLTDNKTNLTTKCLQIEDGQSNSSKNSTDQSQPTKSTIVDVQNISTKYDSKGLVPTSKPCKFDEIIPKLATTNLDQGNTIFSNDTTSKVVDVEKITSPVKETRSLTSFLKLVSQNQSCKSLNERNISPSLEDDRNLLLGTQNSNALSTQDRQNKSPTLTPVDIQNVPFLVTDEKSNLKPNRASVSKEYELTKEDEQSKLKTSRDRQSMTSSNQNERYVTSSSEDEESCTVILRGNSKVLSIEDQRKVEKPTSDRRNVKPTEVDELKQTSPDRKLTIASKSSKQTPFVIKIRCKSLTLTTDEENSTAVTSDQNIAPSSLEDSINARTDRHNITSTAIMTNNERNCTSLIKDERLTLVPKIVKENETSSTVEDKQKLTQDLKQRTEDETIVLVEDQLTTKNTDLTTDIVKDEQNSVIPVEDKRLTLTPKSQSEATILLEERQKTLPRTMTNTSNLTSTEKEESSVLSEEDKRLTLASKSQSEATILLEERQKTLPRTMTNTSNLTSTEKEESSALSEEDKRLTLASKSCRESEAIFSLEERRKMLSRTRTSISNVTRSTEKDESNSVFPVEHEILTLVPKPYNQSKAPFLLQDQRKTLPDTITSALNLTTSTEKDGNNLVLAEDETLALIPKPYGQNEAPFFLQDRRKKLPETTTSTLNLTTSTEKEESNIEFPVEREILTLIPKQCSQSEAQFLLQDRQKKLPIITRNRSNLRSTVEDEQNTTSLVKDDVLTLTFKTCKQIETVDSKYITEKQNPMENMEKNEQRMISSSLTPTSKLSKTSQQIESHQKKSMESTDNLNSIPTLKETPFPIENEQNKSQVQTGRRNETPIPERGDRNNTSVLENRRISTSSTEFDRNTSSPISDEEISNDNTYDEDFKAIIKETSEIEYNAEEKPKKVTTLDNDTIMQKIDPKTAYCLVCNDSFTRAAMRIHMKEHNRNKDTRCCLCQKKFSRYAYLKIHMKAHIGIKNYHCKLCSKSFVRESQLTSHSRVHNREKSYECYICKESFLFKCNLKRHLKKVHLDKHTKKSEGAKNFLDVYIQEILSVDNSEKEEDSDNTIITDTKNDNEKEQKGNKHKHNVILLSKTKDRKIKNKTNDLNINSSNAEKSVKENSKDTNKCLTENDLQATSSNNSSEKLSKSNFEKENDSCLFEHVQTDHDYFSKKERVKVIYNDFDKFLHGLDNKKNIYSDSDLQNKNRVSTDKENNKEQNSNKDTNKKSVTSEASSNKNVKIIYNDDHYKTEIVTSVKQKSPKSTVLNKNEMDVIEDKNEKTVNISKQNSPKICAINKNFDDSFNDENSNMEIKSSTKQNFLKRYKIYKCEEVIIDEENASENLRISKESLINKDKNILEENVTSLKLNSPNGTLVNEDIIIEDANSSKKQEIATSSKQNCPTINLINNDKDLTKLCTKKTEEINTSVKKMPVIKIKEFSKIIKSLENERKLGNCSKIKRNDCTKENEEENSKETEQNSDKKQIGVNRTKKSKDFEQLVQYLKKNGKKQDNKREHAIIDTEDDKQQIASSSKQRTRGSKQLEQKYKEEEDNKMESVTNEETKLRTRSSKDCEQIEQYLRKIKRNVTDEDKEQERIENECVIKEENSTTKEERNGKQTAKDSEQVQCLKKKKQKVSDVDTQEKEILLRSKKKRIVNDIEEDIESVTNKEKTEEELKQRHKKSKDLDKIVQSSNKKKQDVNELDKEQEDIEKTSESNDEDSDRKQNASSKRHKKSKDFEQIVQYLKKKKRKLSEVQSSDDSDEDTTKIPKSDEKGFPCPFCDKVYQKRPNLRYHLNMHSETNQFKCPTCKKLFPRKATLDTHMKIHTDIKDYRCELCDKTFVQNSQLKSHINTHVGVKFKCSICNKSLANKSNVTKHMKIHTGQLDYKCTKCPKRFIENNELKNHMKVHDLSRNIHCPKCSRKFIRQEALEEHIKIHSKNSFKCPLCSKCYNQKSNMRTHMKVVHKTLKP